MKQTEKKYSVNQCDDDRKLIELCQSGDRIAFERLYNRFAKDVYSMAFRMVGSHEIAEEIIQEVFISVYRDIKRFQFQSAFTTWLYRIVLRRSADYFRKHRKYFNQTVSIYSKNTDETDIEIEDGNRTPEEWAFSSEKEQLLEKAILSLSEKQRKIVILRYIHHLSYEDIAEILNCRLGTVKSRLNRAHKALEKKLEKIDFF